MNQAIWLTSLKTILYYKSNTITKFVRFTVSTIILIYMYIDLIIHWSMTFTGNKTMTYKSNDTSIESNYGATVSWRENPKV